MHEKLYTSNEFLPIPFIFAEFTYDYARSQDFDRTKHCILFWAYV